MLCSHKIPTSESWSSCAPSLIICWSVHQVLAVVGSGPALGNWDAARAVRLSWREGHRWVANVQLEAGWHGALEFKVRSALIAEGLPLPPSPSNHHCLWCV